jgi:hypothetical protein
MVGASGAIAGVLGAYLVLYPRAPILVVNPIPPLWFVFGLFLEFPAWLVVGEWFLWNLVRGVASLGVETIGAWRSSRTSVASFSACWRSGRRCSGALGGRSSAGGGGARRKSTGGAELCGEILIPFAACRKSACTTR